MPGQTESIHTKCCIAGGGPAGMMMGYLLARAGVDVLVLEKHADFLRDFRGDTIHPSTLQVMHELGILDEFLKRPHQEAREIHGWIGDAELAVADFTHLPGVCKFIAFMPQWDFLDFLCGQARKFPSFHLKVEANVTGLIEQDGKVAGVQVTTPQGPMEVRSDLVVGADGRHSTVRAAAGLTVDDLGAPMDVLWLRLSKEPGDPKFALGRFDRGKIFIMLDRGEYWQCGFVIPKGAFDEIRSQGMDAFRAGIVEISPFMKSRVQELRDWSDVHLLTVKVDRLRQWFRQGLLCIGDAAHAMSPVGGVGINLAIQDAVAAARILAEPLRAGTLSLSDLALVQRRREFPARVTQKMQIAVQKRVIGRVLSAHDRLALPFPLRVLRAWPFLRRIPARLIGIGVRPEHVA